MLLCSEHTSEVYALRVRLTRGVYDLFQGRRAGEGQSDLPVAAAAFSDSFSLKYSVAKELYLRVTCSEPHEPTVRLKTWPVYYLQNFLTT